jgi:hypothetical protein
MKCGRDADWPVEVRLNPNKQKPKTQPPFENQTPESAGESQNRSCTNDKTNSPPTDQSVDYSVLSPCTNDAPRTCVPTSKKVLAYFGKQHCKREKTATRLTSNTSDSGKRKGGGLPRTSVRAGTPPRSKFDPKGSSADLMAPAARGYSGDVEEPRVQGVKLHPRLSESDGRREAGMLPYSVAGPLMVAGSDIIFLKGAGVCVLPWTEPASSPPRTGSFPRVRDKIGNVIGVPRAKKSIRFPSSILLVFRAERWNAGYLQHTIGVPRRMVRSE